MIKVLVVYKRSFMELRNKRSESTHPLTRTMLRKIKKSDQNNKATKKHVLAILKSYGMTTKTQWRGNITSTKRYDLVISIGGDGTFIGASHYIKDTPILGVNSDPSKSVAIFSCTDSKGFEKMLQKWINKTISITALNRSSIRIGKRKIPELVINEVLFAHQNPAALSRYQMKIKTTSEEHRSSGIWISTAAGSSGAILSAGGSIMSPRSSRIQYLVREPYLTDINRFQQLKGLSSHPIKLTSLMNRAMLFIDGTRVRYPVLYGETVHIQPKDRPLYVVGFNQAKQRRLKQYHISLSL